MEGSLARDSHNISPLDLAEASMSRDTRFISTLSLSHFLLLFPHQRNGEHMPFLCKDLLRTATSLIGSDLAVSGSQAYVPGRAGPCWGHVVHPRSPSPFSPLVPMGPAWCPLQGPPIHHLVNPFPSPLRIPHHYLLKEGTRKVVIIPQL